MSAVSVRDLKNGLSKYLRKVQAGERLVVTERGRPVAELSPVRSGSMTLDERLAKLEEEGELTLPHPRKRGRGSRRPVGVRGRPLAETLLEDRG